MFTRLWRGGAVVALAASMAVIVPATAQADVGLLPWSALLQVTSAREAASIAGRVILPRAALAVDAAPCAGWSCALKVLSWGYTAWSAKQLYDTWNAPDEPTTGGPAQAYPASGAAGGNTTPVASAGLYAWGKTPGTGAPAINLGTPALYGVLALRWNPVPAASWTFGRGTLRSTVGYWVRGSSTRWTTTTEVEMYPLDTIPTGSAASDRGCGLDRATCANTGSILTNLLAQAKVQTGNAALVTGDIYVDWLSSTLLKVDTGSTVGEACVGCTVSWTGSAPTAAQLAVSSVVLPSLTYSASVDCRRANGTKFTITGPSMERSGSLAGVVIPSCADVEAGSANWDVRVNRNWGGTVTPLAHSGVNESWIAQNAPNCMNGPCTLDWYLDGTPCTVGRAGCTTTDLAELNRINSPRLSCRFGGYGIANSECVDLSVAYMPAGAPKVNPTDPPVAKVAPAPTPSPTATPDPTMGLPVPAPAPRPTDFEENACWPTGWGVFNPASWVLKPAKCALTWAFVPSGDVVSNFRGGVRSKWNESPPGKWLVAAGGLTPVIASGGCRGPAVPTGFMGQGFGTGPFTVAGPAPLPAVIYPFDACSGVMATAAATSYLVLSAGISFYGGMKVVRQLGYAFGFQVHIGSERSTFT